MPTTEAKIVQYLQEARGMELALVRTLQAHSAMTPAGPYRTLLERHLRETRGHADRVNRRLADLGYSPSIAESGYGLAQRLVGQLLALGKAPLDLVRGGSGEEKLLKNAKDECATEALEIATYDALEQLARQAGDERTAKLAADHRAEEERTLKELRALLPRLTADVVGAEVEGEPTYDVTRTGAADRVREVAEGAQRTAADAVEGAARATRSAAREAGRAAADTAQDAARTARTATGTTSATQEREESRAPLPKYDELSVEEVTARLDKLTGAQLRHVATYEQAHKRRRGVLDAVARKQEQQERETANA